MVCQKCIERQKLLEQKRKEYIEEVTNKYNHEKDDEGCPYC